MFNDEHKLKLEEKVNNFLRRSSLNLANRAEHEILRDQTVNLMNQAKYSGAEETLDEICTVLGFYKHLNRELTMESQRIGENEGQISDKGLIMEVLSEEMD